MSKIHKSRAIPAKIAEAREIIIKELPIGKYIVDNNLIYGDLVENGNGKMLCPVHDDHTPSCFYNTEKNNYNCFACGSKGSVVEMDYGIHKKTDEKENIVKTILRLASKYNIDIPNMFEYEQTNLPQKNKIKKQKLRDRQITPEQEDKIYQRKLQKLEDSVRNPINLDKDSPDYITNEQRFIVYYNCDRVLLGEVSAKEMYFKIKNFLNK